ncbi:SEC23-interacting protein (p125),putative [Schistosoma mansoni]|uniref:SEC23-interacting protein (p125),putative n=1 Tax=Schistosoma mansoni TaxID=6183 RepID=UPI00022C87A1|nr:SEC23-interacting protein (p125),putative [Schistosoma mansoni]|eukprot:XP_018645152.1 SEC23-interacting protein (p125),putative [Schistosoma mansoni]
MSYERQSNSTISNPSLSGLALNLSQASIPTGPILLPQFISPRADELSSFIGENPVNTTTSIPGSEEKSLDSGSSLAKNINILEVSSSAACSFKPIASTTVKPSQRPRYVLPPDINTFASNTPTSVTNIPPNSSLKPSSTFKPNQLLPPFPPSNPQNNIQTEQLPVLMETVDQQTQCTNQNIDPTSTISSSVSMRTIYHPVGAHWFYSTTFEKISVWWPFSRHDSYQIETEFFRSSTIGTHEIVVQVDGGRYDVHLTKRERRSVYWDESPGQVRRATWFYKPQGESRVLPFSERTCDLLEAQYKLSVEQGQWAWPYDLSSTTNSGNVVAGTSSPLIHLDSSQISQEMSLTGQLFEGRVCYLHRGLNEQLMEQIDEGDYKPIDQLFFIVHGIGSIYNLKGQGLIECVNDMRRTAKQLGQTHFPYHPYRVEFLPILWHDELHSDTVTGLDKQLEQITLGSIPKLRQFTNDSLMDILFYTSSRYSQLIVNTVAREITRLRELFLSRNPNFSGNISIIGHSLGAVISFDLLCHQTAYNPSYTTTTDQPPIVSSSTVHNNNTRTIGSTFITDTDSQSRTINDVNYVNKLLSEVKVDQFTDDVSSSKITATSFPAATITSVTSSISSGSNGSTTMVTDTNTSMNISSLSSASSSNNAGFGITLPNYPQLGFTISGLYTLGSPIPLFLTARGIKTLSSEFHLPTCSTFYNIFHPFDPVAYRMETLIDSEFQVKIMRSVSTAYTCGSSSNEDGLEDYENVCNITDNRNDVVTTTYRNLTTQDLSFNSRLNQGRRMDYVLQEATLESFNEYLFALTSHATYWDSVDTVLFILTEAYSEKGIAPIMPGQKNMPQNTIHVRALSPSLTSAGSTSVHSVPNPPSVIGDSFENVNSGHQMSASQQFDHLVSLSAINQNQPYLATTAVASTVSSISTISNIQGQLPPSLSYMTPPPVILTTTNDNNTHYIQTMVTDSYYQAPISQLYSSADPLSSHIPSDCLTQKYISPQISVCMSQEFSNTAGNYLQTQKQQYSNIPAYAHRKQISVTNPTTSSFTPSILPFRPTTPPTSSAFVNHPMSVVPSIIPGPLCTPTNIFMPASTIGENTFCSSSQMFPPVSQ